MADIETQTIVTLPAGSAQTLIGANPQRTGLRWMNVGFYPMTVVPALLTVIAIGAGFNYSPGFGFGYQGGADTLNGPVVPTNGFSAVSAVGTEVIIWESNPAAPILPPAAVWVIPPAILQQPPVPGPSVNSGWSIPYPGNPLVQSVGYDRYSKLLYFFFNPAAVATNPQSAAAGYPVNGVQAFWGVPLGVYQALSVALDPFAFYSQRVAPNYHMILLSEIEHNPVLDEVGNYIFTT